MQVLYRSPDGKCWASEEDCLHYEDEMGQSHWDRVNALNAFVGAAKRIKKRELDQGPF